MKLLKQTSLCALSLLIAGSLWAGTFTEPSTIFYGKILGSGSGQPVILHEGELSWTLEQADGTTLELRATLTSLKDGEYSYRLDVPHSALSLGLESITNSLPLGAVESIATFPSIEVDGSTAQIVGNLSQNVILSQDLRSSTYRMDLEIPMPFVDSDGDGIPDWWEDRYGLDKQDGSDASGDLDGDGLSNLDEFLQGYDPTQDSREPQLLTTDQGVYANAENALLLQTADIDSTPAQLTYTLLSVPGSGTLLRRDVVADPSASDVALQAGDSFTGADLLASRIVFVHDGADAPTSFQVGVEDEEPSHAASTGRVWLYPFAPTDEQLDSAFVQNGEVDSFVFRYLAVTNAGHVAVDATGHRNGLQATAASFGADAGTYSDQYGTPQNHVFIGGNGRDTFSGGLGDDHAIGLSDGDSFAGGPGADRVTLDDGVTGSVTIEGFLRHEVDVLDLSRVVGGSSSWIDDYLTVAEQGGSAALQVDLDGDGSGPDVTVVLAGVAVADFDAGNWVESGNLVVGELQPMPRVFIASPEAAASENGPTSASFVAYRTGDASEALTVGLQWSGAAVNGVDFSLMDDSVSFAAGQKSVALEIVPFVDSSVEPAEVVEVSVLAGAGYVVGTPAQGQLTIEDLMVEVAIEALVGHAETSTFSPGALLITRSAVLDRSVLVRLQISGTATGGVDYQPLLPFVNFTAGQTTAILPITPLASASLADGAESVRVKILEDSSYRIGNASMAEVVLVEQADSFGEWMGREHPDETGSLGNLADAMLADYASAGKPQLMRMAEGFRLDVPLRPEAVDVRVVIEMGHPQESWTDAGGMVKRSYPSDGEVGVGVRCYELQPAAKELPEAYIRARLEYTP